MELVVHQQIIIQKLDVGSVTNSSVLQIGSAGQIKALSNLFNTGAFTEPAPPAVVEPLPPEVVEPFPVTLVPLPPPAPA